MTIATRFPVLLGCLGATLLLTACSDGDAPDAPSGDGPSWSSEGRQHKAWMQTDSTLTPAQWLVSHGEAKAKPVHDPAVRKVATDLAAAKTVYHESERMIANRTVQLEGMLREIGVEEAAPTLLEDLMQVAGGTGQTEGYGAISQHYFNLRANRVDRKAALAQLASRYGSRR